MCDKPTHLWYPTLGCQYSFGIRTMMEYNVSALIHMEDFEQIAIKRNSSPRNSFIIYFVILNLYILNGGRMFVPDNTGPHRLPLYKHKTWDITLNIFFCVLLKMVQWSKIRTWIGMKGCELCHERWKRERGADKSCSLSLSQSYRVFLMSTRADNRFCDFTLLKGHWSWNRKWQLIRHTSLTHSVHFTRSQSANPWAVAYTSNTWPKHKRPVCHPTAEMNTHIRYMLSEIL